MVRHRIIENGKGKELSDICQLDTVMDGTIFISITIIPVTVYDIGNVFIIVIVVVTHYNNDRFARCRLIRSLIPISTAFIL
uniref:Uncharacterized protein n=1 Tax=Onchocerca volvulus TaxID=6282 RepID=A0A8R1TM99_ONCVO